jgi:hypothetical protein
MTKNTFFPSLILVLLSSSCFGDSSPIRTPSLDTASLSAECNALLLNNNKNGSFNQGVCIGIILGVEDNAHYDKKICVPGAAGLKARLVVVKSYIDTQPERKGEAYASLVFDALIRKWPHLSSKL